MLIIFRRIIIFLPTTNRELQDRSWDSLDIILITGDSYIDSPFIGVSVIGKVLAAAGYRVGIIGQPDVTSARDIARLGEPKLFWGVTGGCIDSMVANRTASGRKRRQDDYTAGGINNRRPDRAVIVYSNLIRSQFKNTRPIVLGGIEASLRRIAHYDFWSNKIRKSILFDAKADFLLYGMAERSVVELAECLKAGRGPLHINGLCYIGREMPENALELPSYQEAGADKKKFTAMFHTFYRNNDPLTAVSLAQRHDNRYLIQNPPAAYLSQTELDAISELDYERQLHPYHEAEGTARALDTIRFSIATHRGCYGECNFCAIAVHQGRTVRWRSKRSILKEARQIAAHPAFKGIIQDVGGPTANMYGFECQKKLVKGSCEKKRCLFPKKCPSLPVSHQPQIELLREIRTIKNVRRVFVASGLRYDMILADQKSGAKYLDEVVRHHVSGQMKIAPEHCRMNVLQKMGKPGAEFLLEFIKLFRTANKKANKQQFLTYYMIAAHPGCSEKDMTALKAFAIKELQVLPEQVQIFTPTPSTYSTLMYWTERDPFSDEPCFVEKSSSGRERQKKILAAPSRSGKKTSTRSR